MSFVIADTEAVIAAAGNLSGIETTLREAAAAAAAPTTQVAAAAADEISAAVSRLFGTFGQDFQAINAQAAAFHAEFVRLLNGGAGAYLSTEIVNAEQTLLSALNAPAQTLLGPAAAAVPPAAPLLGIPGLPEIPVLGGGTGGGLLGGLGGLLGGSGGILDPILFGGTGGLLGPLIGGNGILSSLVGGGPLGPLFNGIGQQFGNTVSALINGSFFTNPLQVLLPGLFPQTGGAPAIPAFGGAWQQLFLHTSTNLQALGAAIAADPFPLLRQIIANQQGYAYLTGRDLALAFENLPTEIANFPQTIQNGIQSLATFSPAYYAQTFANGTLGSFQTLNTSFAAFGRDLQINLAKFPADWSVVGQDIAAGQYNLAVSDGTRAVLNVFLSGFDTSNLADIKLVGPVGDLFPVLSLPGQQLLGASTLIPAHSIPAQMTANLGRFFTALADTSVSTTISGQLVPTPQLVLGANFGLPLQLLFGVAGAPVAGLNGLATAGTVIGGGIATGNPLQILSGLIDSPAYVLDGLLNGEAIVNLPLPVSFSVLGLDINVPVEVHLPFNGLIVPPHAITATVPIELLNISAPINLTLGGTKFGGLAQLLATTGFRTLADAIAN
ncbi:PE family protein [Mycobacterium sp. 1423905.2]|uniref:PE family protein n=1 Tax=Mycobacterium sp. 1423905.2 TaxID=1856859 RepID=UPI0007FFD75C|nr:PE family protein [Mycobacterium sp. 1423905.2]OBJ60606.1 PE-PGRS family protein [Mycobacterium sp. 1423905.2]